MRIYETEIIGIGAEAHTMVEEDLIITFGEDSPDDIAEYCYTVKVNKATKEIEAGMTLVLDNERFKITAVGRVANRGLNNLGHISMYFDGSAQAALAGAISLEAKAIPPLKIGSVIAFED